MPCSDGGPSHEQLEEQRHVPAILCGLLTALERHLMLEAYLAEVDWEAAGVSQAWAIGWWAEHQRQDTIRRERAYTGSTDPTSDDDMETRARDLGLDVVYADDHHLQLDLDTEAQQARFPGALALLVSLGEEHPEARVTDGTYETWSSKSGDGQHVVLQLTRPCTTVERIALQAILGSDPARELLSLVGAWSGRAHPIVLFRPRRSLCRGGRCLCSIHT